MRTIGKYIVRGLLGRGQMGKIYKVEHPVIGKIAALKALDPDPLLAKLLGEDNIRNMFVAEAVTLAGLRHPNIVEILEFDESDGRPFYLMAYHANNLGVMIGESARPDEPSRRIRLEKAVHYMRQTLQGLACLHYGAVIHRDIKPYNLLVTEQDTVKICDFGLSKLHGERFAGPPALKVGSPWYAPPEQESNPDRVDVTADLFSAGVTFFRMLTGMLPSPEHPLVSALNPDLNSIWDKFFRKALAHRPRDRFRSARAMLAALDRLDRAWQEHKERYCRLASHPPTVAKTTGAARKSAPRRHCVKIDPRGAKAFFTTDRLWRPSVFRENALRSNDDGTITDGASGLVWQQSGSEFPVDWHRARETIDRLNASNWAGHRDWRLPTVDELMTLLTPEPTEEDRCIEPLFDPCQKWLWSCDRRSFTAAWYVSTDMGYVAWQDFDACLYVRAVRSASTTTRKAEGLGFRPKTEKTEIR